MTSEYWYTCTHTWPDTVPHEVVFIDSNSNENFDSDRIRIDAPSTNSSAVEFSFTPSGNFFSVAVSGNITLTSKKAKSIYIKLGTADDSVIVTVW